MVAFEVFDKKMNPLAKAPVVTIQNRRVISLHKAAHELIDSPETVELLFDAIRSVMALPPADDTSPHAYAARAGSMKGPGQAMVSATAFTQHYGIDATVTRRWRPFVEDGMLCIDLTEPGTVIEGNRTKKRTSPSSTPAPTSTTVMQTRTPPRMSRPHQRSGTQQPSKRTDPVLPRPGGFTAGARTSRRHCERATC